MTETTELDQGINDIYRDLLDIQNELIPVRPPQTLFREVIESDTYDDQVESLNESLDWLPEGPQSDAIIESITREILEGIENNDPGASQARDRMIEEGTWPPDAGGETETPTDEEPEKDPLPDRDAGGGENPLPENEPFENPPASPLVIDLDGDGVELVSLADSTAYFDLNVDGFAERTGWVSSDDGLLALDVNGNGQIDDNSELFGNMTGFDNGFLQLAQLDENGDGVINALDASYSSLVIWRDYDQDGISDNGELVSLADTGIASISLASVAVSETNLDHLVSDRSSVTFIDGTVGVIEDIHFQNDLSDSYALLDDSFEYNQEAVSLPVLWGYGAISSTWVSLSENEALRAEARSLLESLNNGDVVSFHEGFEDFILEWAGVNSNATDSRGAYIDARHLEFLEAVYGTSFDQNGNSNPGHIAASALEAQYDTMMEQLAGRFLAQSTRAEALLTATSYEDIVSIFDSHPLTEFTLLLDAYSSENRELSGDIAPIVEGLINNINDGSLTVENAALTLFLIQNDVNSDSNQFSADVVAAALNAGADPNSDFIIIMENYEDYQVRVGGATDDVLSADDAATYFIGGDGNDTLTGSQYGNVFFGGLGDDFMTGGDEVDTYIYSLGDGNDTIADWDNNARTDRLVLTDVNASDVTFEANAGDDLILTFSNGETITVINHFAENQDESIEEIEFADGSIMTLADIRNKSVADQKDSGAIIGTDFGETYIHTLGDGSYTIADWDNNARVDEFIFTDVNAADVTVQRLSSDPNDVVLTLSNGDHITLLDQLNSNDDYGMEVIRFADGTSWDRSDLLSAPIVDDAFIFA